MATIRGKKLSLKENGALTPVVSNFTVTGGNIGGESDIAWLPEVSPGGDLSWSRTIAVTPPATRNIKGPQGDMPEFSFALEPNGDLYLVKE